MAECVFGVFVVSCVVCVVVLSFCFVLVRFVLWCFLVSCCCVCGL